jgi:hypothetical protein
LLKSSGPKVDTPHIERGYEFEGIALKKAEKLSVIEL